MGQETLWRSPSLEGKWKDGKGDIVVSRVDYYGKTWLDLRIVRVEDGKYQHTRNGLRLTYEQLKEFIPRCVEFISQYEDEQEAKTRKGESNDDSS